MMFLIYLIIGVFAGFLSGLLGIGGGIIVVPALLWAYQLQQVPPDVLMHMVTATSLAAMIVTTLVSFLSHMRHGSKIWPVYQRLWLGVLFGTVLGVVIAAFLRSKALEIIFAIFLFAVAIWMLINKPPKKERNLPKAPGMFAFGSGVGIFSGLLGIGGGVISVPTLNYFNVSMRDAVGISTAISFTVAVVGTMVAFFTGSHAEVNLPHWSTGFVYWPAVLGITIGSPLFAMLGAELAHRLPVPILKRIFAIFLLLTALKLII